MPIDPTTTNLEGKDYTGRDLRGINLAYHRCMYANFTGADLRGVSFVGADCTKADFTGAQLEGADFTGAILDGVTMPSGIGETIIARNQPATIEVAPQGDSGSPVVWQLEENSKAQEQEIALLRQQLDDALAEIRRLTTPESDQSDLLMEEDRPAPARRRKAQP